MSGNLKKDDAAFTSIKGFNKDLACRGMRQLNDEIYSEPLRQNMNRHVERRKPLDEHNPQPIRSDWLWHGMIVVCMIEFTVIIAALKGWL